MVLGTVGVPVSQGGHLTKLSGSLCLQPSVSGYCSQLLGESIKNRGVGPLLVVFPIPVAESLGRVSLGALFGGTCRA